MSVFYEKLASAKKSKKRRGESEEKKLMRAALGLGAAGVGSIGGQMGAGALYGHMAKKVRRPDEADRLRKLHAKINPEVAQIISEDSIPKLTRNTPFIDFSGTKAQLKKFRDGGAAFVPNIAVNPATGLLEKTQRTGLGSVKTRGMISSSLKGSDSSALMHELGHATGKLGYGKHKLYDKLVSGSIGLTRGAPGHLFGLGRAAAESYNIGGAKSKEDLDRINRRTNIGTALHGLAAAPLLFEEGRANLRAIGLGKKFGAKVSKRKLGAAMGTYLANAAGQTLLPHYILKRQIKNRRKALASEE